jgi:hypothetical protein
MTEYASTNQVISAFTQAMPVEAMRRLLTHGQLDHEVVGPLVAAVNNGWSVKDLAAKVSAGVSRWGPYNAYDVMISRLKSAAGELTDPYAQAGN